jgi:predicted O-methyltransferase YrrM
VITHGSIIKSIINNCGYKTYLELGVYDGENLLYVGDGLDRIIGVDITDKRNNKSTNFYLGYTDSFFEQNKETFDVIFIDACHNIEQVIKDFNNSIKCLNKNGVIFLHDTDPESEYLLHDGYCSDSYKMNNYLKINGYNYITLPCLEAGITIVSIESDNRMYNKYEI